MFRSAKLLCVAAVASSAIIGANLAQIRGSGMRLLPNHEARRLIGGTADQTFIGYMCEANPNCLDAYTTVCFGTAKADCAGTREDVSFSDGNACTKESGEAYCQQSGWDNCHWIWGCRWSATLNECESFGLQTISAPTSCWSQP